MLVETVTTFWKNRRPIHLSPFIKNVTYKKYRSSLRLFSTCRNEQFRFSCVSQSASYHSSLGTNSESTMRLRIFENHNRNPENHNYRWVWKFKFHIRPKWSIAFHWDKSTSAFYNAITLLSIHSNLKFNNNKTALDTKAFRSILAVLTLTCMLLLGVSFAHTRWRSDRL